MTKTIVLSNCWVITWQFPFDLKRIHIYFDFIKKIWDLFMNSMIKFRKVARYLGFFFVGLVFRWPLWMLLGLIRFFNPFQYLFLVYPGTDDDLRGFAPKWLGRTWLFFSKPVIAGVITGGKGSARGLLLVIPNTILELANDKSACEKIVKRLRWIRILTGAKTIAMAGRLPSIMNKKHGIEFTYPFSQGMLGTVFCIMDTIETVIKEKDLRPGDFNIVLVGVGFVGGLLQDALLKEGHSIKGVDIRPTRRGIIIPSRAKPIVEKADMVIVLTPEGKDFSPYTEWLKPGAIVIDDTHPRIADKPSEVEFYKVAVGLEGISFFPSLPKYKANWIPGCTVEAIVSAVTGDCSDLIYKQFNQRAKKIGFFAHLVS